MWGIISSAGREVHKRCTEAFLFSMVNPYSHPLNAVNPEGLEPTTMPLRTQMQDYAIFCSKSNGPTFGRWSDLYISDNAHKTQSGSNLDKDNRDHNTYELPQGQEATFFTGRKTFTVADYEVFRLQKPWQQSIQVTLRDIWLIHHGCYMKRLTLCRDGGLQKQCTVTCFSSPTGKEERTWARGCSWP